MSRILLAMCGAVCLLVASDGHAKAVGACNTEGGCRDLARACGKTKGHTYKPAGTASGVCDDGKAAGAASQSLAANVPTSRLSTCATTALCNNLKKTCRGTYTTLTPTAGQCSN